MSLERAKDILKTNKWMLAKNLMKVSAEYAEIIRLGGQAMVDIFDTVFIPEAEKLQKEAEATVQNG